MISLKLLHSLLAIAILFLVCDAKLSHRVTHLPQIGTPSVTTYAGYLTIDEATDSNIFYYFVESQSSPQSAPVALWLQGGPGVSSMMGAFLENGPYNMQANGSLTVNPYSWNRYANMLYLDQPLGTGYSYTDDTSMYPTTEEQVSADIYEALQLFFTMYPEYADLDFYITGESYAGKYIPSLSTYIYNQNDNILAKKDTTNKYILLKGLAIGNGWVDPLIQNQAYVDYPYNLGLISPYQRDQAQLIMNQLSASIAAQDWLTANNLSNDLEAYVVGAAGNIDEDNVLYPSDPLSNGYIALNTYLNSEEVRTNFHVGNHTWEFENNDTSNALNADEQQTVLPLLPNLIANYRVMIYTGNMDLNCNVLGVENYLNSMVWPYNEDFYKAARVLWYNAGNLAGYAQTVANLTSVVVRNAGHEVPFFQPSNSLDMFRRFIMGKPF